MVAEYDRNFEGWHGTRPPQPLPNVLLRVKARGKVYQTLTDSQGLYAFYNLPSGKYEFVPELPPGTSLSWYMGSDEAVSRFDVHSGSCQERNLEVFPSGSIQGRVLDSSDNLIRDAFVYVMPADKATIPSERELYWESQGWQEAT